MERLRLSWCVAILCLAHSTTPEWVFSSQTRSLLIICHRVHIIAHRHWMLCHPSCWFGLDFNVSISHWVQADSQKRLLLYQMCPWSVRVIWHARSMWAKLGGWCFFWSSCSFSSWPVFVPQTQSDNKIVWQQGGWGFLLVPQTQSLAGDRHPKMGRYVQKRCAISTSV